MLVSAAVQPLDRPDKDEVEESVRVIAVVTAHEVERVTAYAGRRDELAERNGVAVGAMRYREQ